MNHKFTKEVKVKRILMVFVLICLVAPFAIGQKVIYPEGILSYWKFEELESPIIFDSVGENHGALSVNVQSVWTDIVGYGLMFQDGYVRIPDHESLNPEHMTLEAWIYVDSLSGCYNTAIAKNSDVYYHLFMLAFGCETHHHPEFWVQTESETRRVEAPERIQEGTWMHWAGTYDGEHARLYLNGEKVAQLASSLPIRRVVGPLFFGRNVDAGNHHFYGILDEVALYNRALTPEEIQLHYENGQKGLGYEILALEASTEITPHTINLKSKGKWITTYLELPAGYNVADIDISTVKLDDIHAEEKPSSIGDNDEDGILDLMLKFDRQAIQGNLSPGNVKITITGQMTDGTNFEGSDTVRVI